MHSKRYVSSQVGWIRPSSPLRTCFLNGQKKAPSLTKRPWPIFYRNKPTRSLFKIHHILRISFFKQNLDVYRYVLNRQNAEQVLPISKSGFFLPVLLPPSLCQRMAFSLCPICIFAPWAKKDKMSSDWHWTHQNNTTWLSYPSHFARISFRGSFFIIVWAGSQVRNKPRCTAHANCRRTRNQRPWYRYLPFIKISPQARISFYHHQGAGIQMGANCGIFCQPCHPFWIILSTQRPSCRPMGLTNGLSATLSLGMVLNQ